MSGRGNRERKETMKMSSDDEYYEEKERSGRGRDNGVHRGKGPNHFRWKQLGFLR